MGEVPMTHRQVLEAMSGLLLGLFVAMLSSTVVSTALPVIVADLGGTQSAYVWLVTASLLALTVTTPIWGKLADLFDRKLLVQSGLVIFVIASICASLAQSTNQLIAFRVVQGVGVGGMTALVQVIFADLVSPRERGRYAGYIGAVFGIATVAGPLLGGVVTDLAGWRACFYVGVPIAAGAFAVLQRTLHLPPRPARKVRLDYAGATLIALSVSSLLILVTLAGQQFAWVSAESAGLLITGVLAGALAVRAERRHSEPLVPLRLFANRTVVLSVIASVAVGTALFGTTVFLSQYLQLARGMTPTESGLLSIPMVIGMFISSTVIGRRITHTGRYKRWMVTGATMLTLGLALMGTLDETTSLAELGVFMFVVGLGVGMLMQNLVLVVQNTVGQADMGAGSALIAFFRSLGGAAGVSVLGAVLASSAASSIRDGLAGLGIHQAIDPSKVPDLSTLPPDVARVVEHAYGISVGEIFLLGAPVALVALIAVSLMKEVPLGERSGIAIALEEAAAATPRADAERVAPAP